MSETWLMNYLRDFIESNRYNGLVIERISFSLDDRKNRKLCARINIF